MADSIKLEDLVQVDSVETDDYLSKVFGAIVNNPLALDGASSTFSNALSILNAVATVILIIVTFYKAFEMAAHAADKGEVKEFSSAKKVLIVALLAISIPLPSGWNMLQLSIIQTARFAGVIADETYVLMKPAIEKNEMMVKNVAFASPLDTVALFRIVACSRAQIINATQFNALGVGTVTVPDLFTRQNNELKFGTCGAISYTADADSGIVDAVDFRHKASAAVDDYILSLDTLAARYIAAHEVKEAPLDEVARMLPDELERVENEFKKQLKSITFDSSTKTPVSTSKSFFSVIDLLVGSIQSAIDSGAKTFAVNIVDAAPAPHHTDLDEYEAAMKRFDLMSSHRQKIKNAGDEGSTALNHILAKLFCDGTSTNGFMCIAQIIVPEPDETIAGIIAEGNAQIGYAAMLKFASAATSFLPDAFQPGIVKKAQSAADTLAMILFAMGITSAVIIPALPILHFVAAVVVWFVKVAEAVILAPAFLIKCAFEDEKDIFKKVIGYLLPVLLRPVIAVLAIAIVFSLALALLSIAQLLLAAITVKVTSLATLIIFISFAALVDVFILFAMYMASQLITKTPSALEQMYSTATGVRNETFADKLTTAGGAAAAVRPTSSLPTPKEV